MLGRLTTLDGMSKSFRLALIPGDGIGTEVVAEGLTVLDAVSARHGLSFERTEYDLGARRYNATGETLPASVLEELRGVDAILLGAIGDPSVPPGVLERGLLLKLRFELDHYLNLRPVKLFPGVTTPARGQGPGADRLRRVPRGHRGPVRRCRRLAAPGHAARDRDRGERQHGVRRRAHRARRVRARDPSAQAR